MTGRVVVVGLGPAGPELTPTEIDAAIGRIATRFLRTSRHPAAVAVPDAVSFDDVYEREPTLEQVYAAIVDELAAAAAEHGEVLYAVPGSPNVAERTVQLLSASDRVEVDVLPAPSFLDLAWARLGVDPIAAGVRLVDGRSFAVDAAEVLAAARHHTTARPGMSPIERLVYVADKIEPEKARSVPAFVAALGLAQTRKIEMIGEAKRRMAASMPTHMS